LQIWPDGVRTQFLIGRTFRRQGNLTLARQHLQEANLLRYPYDALMLEFHLIEAQSGAIQAVAPILEKEYLANDHADEFLIYEAMVHGFAQHKYFDEAYGWASRWVQRAPRDWYPYYQRGLVLELGKNRRKAMEDYRYVLALKPDQADVAVLLANILRQDTQTKNFEEALELYQACLRSRPGYRAARLGIGLCCKAMGNLPAARENLEAVLASPNTTQDPEDFEAVLALGQLDLGEDKPAKALPWLQKAAMLAPADTEAQRQLAAVLRTLGQDAAAKKAEERYQQLDKAYGSLDQIMRELRQLRPEGRDEEGKSKFVEKSSQLRCQAGMTLMGIGQEQEAVGWLLSATQLDPKNEEARKALADYQREKGPYLDKLKAKSTPSAGSSR
jgi:tetratricopeptide (TPR) repeat protein